MDKIINVYIHDKNKNPVAGAKVSWRVKHNGVYKTLGPVTTQGFSNRPVKAQIVDALDDPLVEIIVSFRNKETKCTVTVAGDNIIDQNIELDEIDPNFQPRGQLETLTYLLDRAVSAVPEVAYAWGTVGIGAAGAIIRIVLGGSWLGALFIMCGTFAAMFLLIIFVRMVKSNGLVVQLTGALIFIVISLSFVTLIGASTSAVVFCKPSGLVYIFDLDKKCFGHPA